MAKRLLDATASELASYKKEELLESIVKSEGRVIAAECIGLTMPLLTDVTNAEFVSAMGADIVLLNMFDVNKPVIQALPVVEAGDTIRELKRLTGRVIGLNLEPVEEEIASENQGTLWEMSEGRKATAENAAIARDMGVNMILLTGNPGNGVSNKAITDSLKALKKEVGKDVILAAGKMHASGIVTEAAENIITKEDIESFVQAGADIILLPAPGTVPGITLEYVKTLITYAHSLGALTITSIGTSQEGADTQTIRQIALMCKMAGTDIHHIGDTGYPGMALPENIQAYSVAVRGVRHTYHRIASSVNR
ncbi:MAG: haloacid dehalogenase-like hydrolase [Lachnospiraceae bacterium]|nr:haloacid dehalogenase-like hydrolase [Lachnospiraceae bacterium]